MSARSRWSRAESFRAIRFRANWFRANWFRANWFRAWADERGNVAIIFCVTLIPVCGIAACAIDYGRASHLGAQMQRAVDAAAAEAQDQLDLDNKMLADLVRAHVAANLPKSLKEVPVTVSPSRDRQSLTVSMATTVPTTLMAVVGIPTLDVGAKIVVRRRQPPAEPVLAGGPGAPSLPGLPPEAERAVRGLIDRAAPSAAGAAPPLPPVAAGDIAARLRVLEQLAGGGKQAPPPAMSEQEVAAELARALEVLRGR